MHIINQTVIFTEKHNLLLPCPDSNYNKTRKNIISILYVLLFSGPLALVEIEMGDANYVHIKDCDVAKFCNSQS